MEKEEIVQKIKKSCIGFVFDVEGRFYYEGTKVECIGGVFKDGVLSPTMFFLDVAPIITLSDGELRELILKQIKA